jgi:hypothetical protein
LYCFANIIVLLKQNKSISVQHIAQFVSAKWNHSVIKYNYAQNYIDVLCVSHKC